MGRLAPDNRPIAADILRGRSSSPQLRTTEEASFISKVASHQCSLWPAPFSLSENRQPPRRWKFEGEGHYESDDKKVDWDVTRKSPTMLALPRNLTDCL